MGRKILAAISIVGALAISAALPLPLAAQDHYDRNSYDSRAADHDRLLPRELEALLAPIALYPDQLLAQVLMAATYPRDTAEAAEWARHARNASLRGEALAFALEPWEWDPSVKALVQFPDVLRMLDDEYAWMVRVGNAFLLQERDAMDAIQALRHRAYAAGHLRSTDTQRVRFDNGAIIVDMIDPGLVYIPRYDPLYAYGPWAYPQTPPFFFHRPVVVTRYVVVPALWGWSSWEWHRHRIRLDLPRYRAIHPHGAWRAADDTWRHDPGRRGTIRGSSISREHRNDSPNDHRRDIRRPNWDRAAPGATRADRVRAPQEASRQLREPRWDIAPRQFPPPRQTWDTNRDRREARGSDARSGDSRREQGDRPRRSSYAGPNLSPPGPPAPFAVPPPTAAPRDPDVRRQRFSQEEPRENGRRSAARTPGDGSRAAFKGIRGREDGGDARQRGARSQGNGRARGGEPAVNYLPPAPPP